MADYAVAARLAALFTFFQIALLKRFAPRAGQLLHVDDHAALRREVDLCRRLAVACVALTIAGVLLLAPLLLPLLGNYLGARGLLTWLAIPSFVQAFYATSDRLLIIAGQANVALLLTASSFAVLTTTPFATAHWLGPLAIAAAMIFSVLAFSPIVACAYAAVARNSDHRAARWRADGRRMHRARRLGDGRLVCEHGAGLWRSRRHCRLLRRHTGKLLSSRGDDFGA